MSGRSGRSGKVGRWYEESPPALTGEPAEAGALAAPAAGLGGTRLGRGRNHILPFCLVRRIVQRRCSGGNRVAGGGRAWCRAGCRNTLRRCSQRPVRAELYRQAGAANLRMWRGNHRDVTRSIYHYLAVGAA